MNKKKIIVFSCMILLLAITAVLNVVLANNNLTEESVNVASYFSQYKTERNETRAEQLVELNEILNSTVNAEDTKIEALNLKLKLTNLIEQELLLEELIEARGFSDTVVSMGLNSDTVNVIVKDADFTQDDAITIYTILNKEIDATPDKVTIIPVY